MDAKKVDKTYIIQNMAIFGIVLGIFPFVPENLTTISFIIGVCMLAYRWLRYKQKPDCWGKVQWAPILGMLFFVVMLILASRFSMDVHKSSNVAYNYFKYMKPALMLVILMNKQGNFFRAIVYGLLGGSLWICLGSNNIAYKYFILHQQGRIVNDALFFHVNAFADYLAIILPLLIGFGIKISRNYLEKALYFFSTIYIFISILATQSRGALISLLLVAVFILFLSFLNKKINARQIAPLILGLVIIFAGIYFFLPRDNHVFDLDKTVTYGDVPINKYQDNGRLYLYQGTIKMIKEHVIFGVGLENFQQDYIEHYMVPGAKERDLPHAHNVILAYLSTTGIVGLTGFVVMELCFLRFFWKGRHRSTYVLVSLAVILVFFLHNMVDFFFQIYLIMKAYWILMMPGYGAICLDKDEEYKESV